MTCVTPVRGVIGQLSRRVTAVKLVTGVRAASALAGLKRQIDRFDSTLTVNAARTPPGSWYVDKEFYELEKATVFRNNWVAVCGAHQLKKAGDYITGFVGDEPYLISRDCPEKLHYFYNICRHHGTLLCDNAQGNTSEFVCPYHAWKYAIDGRLTMAKRLRHIEDFSARENSLKKMSGANWFGLLFLNQGKEAEEQQLQNKLKDLTNRIEELGCSADKLTHVGTKLFPQSCNWKVVVDNYLDGGYHVPICHKQLSANLDNDSYKIEVSDGYSIQSSGTVAGGDRQVGDKVLFAHIYPNLFFNRYGNNVDANYVIPTGPETCVIAFDWYMDTDVYDAMSESERKQAVSNNINDSIKVQDEDTEICERVQKGMRSSSFTYGRYAPLVEHAMHDFHIRLANDYNTESKV